MIVWFIFRFEKRVAIFKVYLQLLFARSHKKKCSWAVGLIVSLKISNTKTRIGSPIMVLLSYCNKEIELFRL